MSTQMRLPFVFLKSPLKSKISNVNNTSSNSFLKQEKYLSLKEIIPVPSLYQMKKRILKDRKIRDRATVITENDFNMAHHMSRKQTYRNLIIFYKHQDLIPISRI